MKAASALVNREPNTILKVHVTPGAKEYSLEYDEWRKELKIKVKAPPHQGKANQDLIAFLRQYFKNPIIISGSKTRSKHIKIDNSYQETLTILEDIFT